MKHLIDKTGPAAGRRIAAESLVYISDIMRGLIAEGASVRSIPIAQAEFFGDPARFERLTGQAQAELV